MLTAIQFNCQIHLRAVEIEDIVADRVLPAELESTQAPISKVSPQAAFTFGLVIPQVPGQSSNFIFSTKNPPSPRVINISHNNYKSHISKLTDINQKAPSPSQKYMGGRGE
jgi:hypothetical protein